MSLYISNIASLRATNDLRKQTKALDTVYQRLSSGLRINSSKDDPAGLQISNRLTAEINGYTQANRNANDGIAVAQTADGALEEISNMLQRVRTLAVQSANGTNTSDDRKSINVECKALCEEITRIANQTTYAGATLLNGAGKATMLDANGKLTLHIGANAHDTIKIQGLEAGFTLSKIAATAGVNVGSEGLLTDNGVVRFGLSTASSAEQVIGMVDKFIQAVDSSRGDLGATINRLESVINVNTVTSTNLSDARSRIRDTDYAEEASNLTMHQILQQVAASMLQRVNQNKSFILQLLQG
ncbi:MAG: flagellin [Succinivibrio sp.]|nr:flagellin [Succinivibrio sp.]